MFFTMRILTSKTILGLFFSIVSIHSVSAQGLQGAVIQSVLFGDTNEEGARIVAELKLDEAAIYDSIANRLGSLLNLDRLSNLQYKPFVYSMGKYREFKTMSLSDISRAETVPADLYLKVFLDIDPPSATLVSANLVKTRLTVEVFVFGKDFQFIRKIDGKGTSTGVSSSPQDGSDPFFALTKDEFWYLLDKALDGIYKYPK